MKIYIKLEVKGKIDAKELEKLNKLIEKTSKAAEAAEILRSIQLDDLYQEIIKATENLKKEIAETAKNNIEIEDIEILETHIIQEASKNKESQEKGKDKNKTCN